MITLRRLQEIYDLPSQNRIPALVSEIEHLREVLKIVFDAYRYASGVPDSIERDHIIAIAEIALKLNQK